MIDRAMLEREVVRIVDAAEAAGVITRVLGSIGVAMSAGPSASLLPAFSRTYADIDMAAYRSGTKALEQVMRALGYRDDREIHIASEGARSIFDDAARRIHVDVFYDRLEFCHMIPLAGRLELDRPSIPLADLLLSKLQIVKINDRDIVDVILLLLDHPLGSGLAGSIETARLVELAAADWGLWRTMTQNLEKVAVLAATYPQLDAGRRDRVTTATTEIKRRIDAAPKPVSWRMRARVGDRRQWWTDVDEVR